VTTSRFLPPDTGRRDEPRPVRLYSISELARLTGLSRDSLEREIREGRLRPTRIRSRVLVSTANLEAWLYRAEQVEEKPSGLCRVPLAFRPVSTEQRLTEARRLRAIARGRGGR
jgi:excisionase family DNA binding protein